MLFILKTLRKRLKKMEILIKILKEEALDCKITAEKDVLIGAVIFVPLKDLPALLDKLPKDNFLTVEI